MTKQVLINGSSTSLGSTINGLSNMQLGFFTPAGTAIVAAGNAQVDFILAQGASAGRNPRISPKITKGSVSAVNKKAGAIPTANVINIGYAGSGSLSINVVTDGEYELKLMNMTPLAPPFPINTVVIPTSYWASTLQTPAEICTALAGEMNNYLWRNPTIAGGQFAFVDVLCAQASSAIAGSETLTVVNGSNIVTSSGSSHGLVSGDWVRIGSATALTSPIYKVLSVSGATITLTTPFVGTSASTVAAGELSAVPDAADAGGLKITSNGDWFTTNNWAGGKPNGPLTAVVGQALTGSPVMVTTPFNPGVNTTAQVVNMEYSWLSALGIGNRGTFPYPNDMYAEAAATAASTNRFTVYEIIYANKFADSLGFGLSRISPSGLMIAIPNGVTVTDFEDILQDVTGVTITTV